MTSAGDWALKSNYRSSFRHSPRLFYCSLLTVNRSFSVNFFSLFVNGVTSGYMFITEAFEPLFCVCVCFVLTICLGRTVYDIMVVLTLLLNNFFWDTICLWNKLMVISRATLIKQTQTILVFTLTTATVKTDNSSLEINNWTYYFIGWLQQDSSGKTSFKWE